MELRGIAAQTPGGFERFEQFVEELATTEGRLVTSAGIVLAALAVGLVIMPLAARGLSRLFRHRILPDGVVDIISVVNAYLPTTLARIGLRISQAGVLFVSGVALLVTWGMVDVAVAVVRALWVSLPFAGQVVLTLGMLLAAYILADILQRAVEEFSAEADRVTAHQQEIMLRMGHVAILLVVVSGLLTLWGLDLSGLLVGAGVLGIVLGLAARKTLGSMIAGFVLMFTKPFTVGDWLKVGEHEGRVTHITVMHTTLREFNGELVTIPNDVIGDRPMRNRSDQEILRLETEVGIDYDSDPAHAEEVALEAIESIDRILDAPPPETTTKAFGDSAVVLRLLYWIEDPTPMDSRRATETVIYRVKERFEEEGIEIPFPQRSLSGRIDADGVPGDAESHDGDA